MGKLAERLTITTHGTLLGWRKLEPDKHSYSGQLLLTGAVSKLLDLPKRNYVSYILFDNVTHWPELSGRWGEHYLGERDGVFITMPVSQRAYSKGPDLL